jgi:hypothetical protein
MAEPIDTAARRICDMSPNRSSGGNRFVRLIGQNCDLHGHFLRREGCVDLACRILARDQKDHHHSISS